VKWLRDVIQHWRIPLQSSQGPRGGQVLQAALVQAGFEVPPFDLAYMEGSQALLALLGHSIRLNTPIECSL